jgi:AcrR family transcriptional regulator
VQVIGQAESDMAAADSVGSPELLRTMLRRWWTELASTRASGLAKLILMEAGNFPEIAQFYNDEVISRGQALIAAILRRGMERGEFVPVDPQLMTHVLIAPVIMLMLWTHTHDPCGGGVDPEGFIETFLGLAQRGLARGMP